jgi:hypothetical protein
MNGKDVKSCTRKKSARDAELSEVYAVSMLDVSGLNSRSTLKRSFTHNLLRSIYNFLAAQHTWKEEVTIIRRKLCTAVQSNLLLSQETCIYIQRSCMFS